MALTDEQLDRLEARSADAAQTRTFGDQSVSKRSAKDSLELLDRARYTKQRGEGRSRFRYFRLTGGFESN